MSFPLFDRVLAYIEGSSSFDPELALEVARFQLQHNTFYRSYCEKLGVREFSSFEDVVFLPVEFFKRYEIFSCGSPTGYFLSSGTTGQRSRVPFSSLSLRLYRCSALRSFPFKGCRLFSLIPRAEKFPHSSLAHMIGLFEEICELVYVNEDSFEFSPWQTLRRLQDMKDGDVLFLTSVQLLKLSEAMEEGLEADIKIIETGGYKALPRPFSREELVAFASRRFPAASFYSEYGMAEMFSQFYSDTEGLYRDSPYARVLTGRSGLLKVFDFANLCTVSALLVPDRIVRKGKGFYLKGRITGEIRGCGYVFR